ncbi:hypothetical protein JG687_00017463 [Phytophthora cactorum]|uniref:Uncharacterized protein n=1 Tax=Phytophthora cactorum TaxID=29920 RepID=A0A8T1TPA2_9STRA|nr:hypothetical protein JG687_00017463 [Phytophthora cactorum]
MNHHFASRPLKRHNSILHQGPMRFSYFIALGAAIVGGIESLSATTLTSPLNDWHPCTKHSDAGSSSRHRGAAVLSWSCETPESANTTIDIFVKRFPETKSDPMTASNVWLL